MPDWILRTSVIHPAGYAVSMWENEVLRAAIKMNALFHMKYVEYDGNHVTCKVVISHGRLKMSACSPDPSILRVLADELIVLFGENTEESRRIQYQIGNILGVG